MEVQTRDIGNYIIYSNGQIWSKIRNKYVCKGVNKKGYPQVNIEGKTKTIHRLIAETFLQNPDNLPQVDHIDGNKLNNNVSNLRWCNGLQNIRWAYDKKLFPTTQGELNGASKLSESDVIEIYTNPNRLSGISLSKKFKVSRHTIGRIQNNKTWTHITKDLDPGFRNDFYWIT